MSLDTAAATPRFDTRELLIRKVQSDSHVCVADSAYSVPPKAVGRMVHVRIQRLDVGEAFEIIHNGQVIAQHKLVAAGQRVSLPEHARSIREAAKAARRPQKPRKRFVQVLPDEGAASPALAAAPVVQTRSLAEYERLLESA